MTVYDLSRRRWYRPTLRELEAEAWESELLAGVQIYEFRAATLEEVLDAVRMMGPPPRELGPPQELGGGLEGALVPIRQGQPCWVRLPGVKVPALPIFSTLSALKRALEGMPGFSYEDVLTVGNGRDFWTHLPHDGSIELVMDPFITEERTTRYKRILL